MIKWIAEVGSNHNGELDRALALIKEAAEIGCHAVKFQHGYEVFDPKCKKVDLALPKQWIKHIRQACDLEGIEFGCTALDLQAVEELKDYVDFYKVASYDLTWGNLLTAIDKVTLPVCLSTGMANRFEIQNALFNFGSLACSDIVLMHCVSNYPAQDGRLDRISWIRGLFDPEFRFAIGYSDHTKNRNTILEAAKKVDAIEFHFDLDGQGREYKAGHCWLPPEIGPIIHEINPDWKERAWRRDPEDGLRPMGWMR